MIDGANNNGGAGEGESDSGLPLAFSYRRFSSAAQGAGDSLERQTRAAREWCRENGHKLSSASFEDLGVSAFSGANAEVGALRAFREAVESGAVPQGSTLLVENLDRLSRQQWQRGLSLLTDIVDSGVNLVTLSDGKVFRANQPIDFAEGIMILVGFHRAYEESEIKSKRAKSAWKANTKATLSGDRVRSPKTPGWIEVTGEEEPSVRFRVIPERASVVREVFLRFANGERPVTIARDLERRGVVTSQGGRWRGQTVSALIRSEAPYGHLAVGRMQTKEELDGTSPIPKGTYRYAHRLIEQVLRDYFPRIVDHETERRVRFLLSEREQKGGSPAKPIKPARFAPRPTKAGLTGVLKSADGVHLKRKRSGNSAGYINPVTHQYVGLVAAIDQIMIDWWPEVRKAADIETDAETEGLEMALMDAQETLEYLEARPSTTPRLLLAAQSEVEQLQEEIKRVKDATGLGHVELPRDVSEMTANELNGWVRKVIERVEVIKGERMVPSKQAKLRAQGKMVRKPMYALRVTMRNGVELSLGDARVGLEAHTR